MSLVHQATNHITATGRVVTKHDEISPIVR